jgi:putative spermidine/putrescine transport system ATP-binding protein
MTPYQRDIGMVFQHYALFPHLSVTDNVAFGLVNIGVPRAERQARVHEMLTMVEMADLAHRMPRELSGGQQQRVALARALALRPAVLLLDEPLSNLDSKLRLRMREEIAGLIRRLEMTTVLVTHDQEEAMVLGDRIVVMHQGRAEQVGSPSEIYEAPASRFVAEFIGLCTLLDARVTGEREDVVVVETSRGLTLELRRPAVRVAPGASVVAIIRPEHVTPASASGPGNRLTARVLNSTYLGSLSRHRLLVCGEDLLMECHAADTVGIEAGADIEITVDPARARLLLETDR